MYVDMRHIVNSLSIAPAEVVTIIGCGGKTTLLWGLAGHFAKERVLVTPSAKIGLPQPGRCTSITNSSQIQHMSDAQLQAHYGPGVHLIGAVQQEDAHVKSMPPDQLQRLSGFFDKTFMEGDGSRGLPLKGWAEHEPVIPPCTTMSIGVVTLWPVGKILDATLAHRPEIFCRLSGAKIGEPVTIQHIANVISHPQGLTAKMHGRKVIFFNQVDTSRDMLTAQHVTSLLPEKFLRGISIVSASLHQGTASIVWNGA